MSKQSRIEVTAQHLQEAEDAMQDARNSGDSRSFGYAEQRAIRLRREMAKIDPRGAGNKYLDNLTEAERNAALGGGQ